MSTTAQDIVDRAQAFSTANAATAVSDASEMLDRIRTFERQVFTKSAAIAPDYWAVAESVTSSAASSARTVSLSSLTYPVQRVLLFTLADGREVRQVDLIDRTGELAPRYFVRGLSIVEVDDDWDTASSNAVSGTIEYVRGPASITTSGGLTQTVSLPDEWCSLLVYPLAIYLAHKDLGRGTAEPAEVQRLQAMQDETMADFLAYLTTYGGVQAKRFARPAPDGSKD